MKKIVLMLSIAYGVSKFIMGSVSDRSNPRWFMSLGLLLTSAVTFAFGTIPAIYGSLFAIVALQTLNGWFNGMGWPPSGEAMRRSRPRFSSAAKCFCSYPGVWPLRSGSSTVR